MKKLALLASAIVFALGFGLGAAVAADMPADKIMVDSGAGKKPGVSFDHKVHKDKAADAKCVDCHHNEADGKFKCRDCHKQEAEGDAIKIQDAMHKKEIGKCWSCHRAKEAPAKKKCAECHVKE